MSCVNELGLFFGMYTNFSEPLRLANDSKNRYRQMYGFLRENMTYRESLNYLANDKGFLNTSAETRSSLEDSPEARFREDTVKNLLLQTVFEGC